MPEIPDLEGYCAYFNKRLPGLSVESAEAPISWMARMGREEFEQRMKGHVWLPAYRRAKYLIYPFESGENLVVHAMLTGRFEYVESKQKRPVTSMTGGWGEHIWCARMSSPRRCRAGPRWGRTCWTRN